MAIFEQIPYSNLHNMNLDWLITKMKECISTVEQAVEDIPEIKEDIETLNGLVDALDTRITEVNETLGLQITEVDEKADEAVNLAEYVDGQLGTKVDKRSGIGVEAYIHSGTVQSGVTVGDSANNIPVRTASGSIPVPPPTADNDAVPKSYVDAKQNLYRMLSEHEEIDDTFTFTADGVWTLVYLGLYKTTISMTDRPYLANANVIRITIDGESLIFTRTDSTDSNSFACSNPDFDITLTAPAGRINVITLNQYAESQPSTSTISNIGFSYGYAPVADLALKSEAQEFIFTVEGNPVTYKVVCVDD